MTTTPNVPAPTGALQMVRAEVNVREFPALDGYKAPAGPRPRHALPADRVPSATSPPSHSA